LPFFGDLRTLRLRAWLFGAVHFRRPPGPAPRFAGCDDAPAVIQYSPPRTGSTLVSNAIRLMLGGELVPFCEDASQLKNELRTHSFIKTHEVEVVHRSRAHGFRPYVVTTVRDPVDVILSRHRIDTETATSAPLITEARVRHETTEYIQSLRAIRELQSRYSVLVLHYSDFHDDLDYLIERLARFIPKRLQRVTAAATLIDALEQMEQPEPRGEGLLFQYFDAKTHLHSNHIKFVEPGSAAALLPSRFQKRLERSTRDVKRLCDEYRSQQSQR
jgi:hypothetical protein